MKKQPVIIVGGGPVGLVAALRLSRFGIPSVVLEKSPDVQNDLRASTFHPPTLEMLDDFGITKDLLARGLKTPTWQIRMHETGEKAEFDLSVIANDTPYPFRLQVEQHYLCKLATDLVEADDNIDLRMGHELTGYTQTDDAVTLQVKDSSGETSELVTPFLIAADGGKSFVRSGMDLPFEGLTYPETTILATTTFPFHEHIQGLSNVNYIWFTEGTFSLLRLPELWRCSLYAGKDQSIEEAMLPDNIEARLQAIVPQDKPYEVGEVRPYRIHQRILEDYRVGRILFAGDAAHLNSPSGGMGMNGGIHDAWCLSEKLSAVWKGDEPLEHLDHYTRQRQPIAKEQILIQSHKNRSRMQERDQAKRQQELARMQAIANDPVKARAHLLKSSMIEGLRRAGEIL